MASTPTVYRVAEHVTLWIEQGRSIHIKTREPSGDPVELNEHEARELIQILTELVEKLEND